MKSSIDRCRSNGSQAGGFYMDGNEMIVLGDGAFRTFMETYGHHLRADPCFPLQNIAQDLPPCPNLKLITMENAKKHLTVCLSVIHGKRPTYTADTKPPWWHLDRYDSINKGGFKKQEVISLIKRLYQHYGVQVEMSHEVSSRLPYRSEQSNVAAGESFDHQFTADETEQCADGEQSNQCHKEQQRELRETELQEGSIDVDACSSDGNLVVEESHQCVVGEQVQKKLPDLHVMEAAAIDQSTESLWFAVASPSASTIVDGCSSDSNLMAEESHQCADRNQPIESEQVRNQLTDFHEMDTTAIDKSIGSLWFAVAGPVAPSAVPIQIRTDVSVDEQVSDGIQQAKTSLGKRKPR